ncbi:MAG: hypothetical protein LBT05_07090, partial [Planctomycetaceae bacterium]|nr:hypothetical protein [Planctomycetaceae bacterium]
MIFLILFAVIILLSLLLWGSISSLKRQRLLEDLPTSKTIGVFIGLVELKGTAESESPLVCYFSEKRCVWYSWSVDEYWSRTVTETYTDKDGVSKTRTRTESGWSNVASGGESIPFYLRDELGVVRVNPQRAEIHSQNVFRTTCSRRHPLYYGKGPVKAVANSTGKRSFTEQAILLHQPLYVVGQSRERDDCVATEIAYDSSSPIFLISTSTEESHRELGLWEFRIFGLLFVLFPTIAGIAFVQYEINPYKTFGVPLAIAGTTFLIWGIGWFWTVYNSLVGMKKRVRLDGKGARPVVAVGNNVYVGMYYSDTLQKVDLTASGNLKGTEIALGDKPNPSKERLGEIHWNDATLCFQYWQSCASCHPDGRMDAYNWDLLNDGLGNPKNAKSLLWCEKCPPAMWEGVRATSAHCTRTGFQFILFSMPDETKCQDVDAYVHAMRPVTSPYLVDGKLSERAERGKKIFEDSKIGCATCHPAPLFTDQKLHDVNTKCYYDRKGSFDTPTLVETWRTAPYLHDGRYTNMKDLFKKGKHGDVEGDIESLTEEQLDDLIEYV